MSAPRRGAIIGFGNVAAHGHVPGWRRRADFQIVAVADPAAARRAVAADLLPGVRLYETVEALLATERLDFVDVAAPPAYHAGAIVAAARAGVHALCEKPLTTSWAEYDAVCTAVAQAGTLLYTVHNWKYSEAFRAVRRHVAAGALGTLRSISFDTARNGCAAGTDEWRMQRAVAGGGILVDHGWHAFYLLQALANERPTRIRARLERRRYLDSDVEDTARCEIEFPSLAADVHLTWAADERRTRWQLLGDRGRLLIDDDQLVVERDGLRSREQLTQPLSAGSHHPEWFAGVIDAFRAELADPTASGANQREAECCQLLLDRAYASGAQQARTLAIPHGAHMAERAR